MLTLQQAMPQVLAIISIPDTYTNSKCVCDECGNELDDSWGDPRIRVEKVHPDGREETKMICLNCDYEMFKDVSGPWDEEIWTLRDKLALLETRIEQAEELIDNGDYPSGEEGLFNSLIADAKKERDEILKELSR